MTDHVVVRIASPEVRWVVIVLSIVWLFALAWFAGRPIVRAWVRRGRMNGG